MNQGFCIWQPRQKNTGIISAFRFLQSLYTTWDESFVPAQEAYPGKYITYVRRHDKEWFIGSMTIEARDMTVSLDFLEKGKTYTAYIYSSDDEGGLIVNEKNISSDDTLAIPLKELDGVAVYISENN